jgi:di/tricarboxylate transporter
VAVLLGAIEPSDLYAGLSSDAVVTLALLFPVMKAMGDTGLPDRFVTWFLGNPNSMRPALFRMYVAVALLSGLFNNTPIVVMMIPLLQTFCQRLNFDSKAVLMPLSFASQAGGNLTVLGTSINFVAQKIFAGSFDIGFFTLSLGSLVVCVVGCAYCTIAAPMIFRNHEAAAVVDTEELEAPQRTMQEVQAELGKRNLFNVAMVVSAGSPLIGSAVCDSGIHRIPGVFLLHRVLSPGQRSELKPVAEETGHARMVSASNLRVSLQATVQTRPAALGEGCCEDYCVVAEGWQSVAETVLGAGDVIQVAATAEGVARLRLVRGLELGNEDSELTFLGAQRRKRCLAEACIVDELAGQSIDVQRWMAELNCGIVSIRSMRQPTLCQVSYQNYALKRGDILLLEAPKSMIGCDNWLDHFGIVRQVPDSAPPRNGRRNDVLRSIFICVGLLSVVALAILNRKQDLTMPVMCTIFLTALLLTRGLTLSEAYSEVNASVLFTIVGALALGQAMDNTRLANCTASVIVSGAQSVGGAKAVLVGIYLATVGIGQFLNSAANVAIMGAIGKSVSVQIGMDVGEVALVITYAASACYMAPYGYQTNTLVKNAANYSWGDFVKFGGLLQFLHMIVCVLISGPCASVFQ